MERRDITAYLNRLLAVGLQTQVTDGSRRSVALEAGFAWVQERARAAHDRQGKLMFIGNGGSAGIASHCAIDYSKNGNLRSLAFNDASALTCLGNDLGYENVFARQIDLHARPEDLLMAISSSGASPNILNAAMAARERGCAIVTFSGFKSDNALRNLGDVNFYVDAMEYGVVEITHLVLCHAILDLAMGWRAPADERGDLTVEDPA